MKKLNYQISNTYFFSSYRKMKNRLQIFETYLNNETRTVHYFTCYLIQLYCNEVILSPSGSPRH